MAFDINQVTRALQFDFASTKGSPKRLTGPLAGTDCFNPGDTLGFSVTATGQAKDKFSIEVIDFCVVSQSTGLLGKYALSLFDAERAVNRISNWNAPKVNLINDDEAEGRNRIVSTSSDVLPVIAKMGSWKISGHLSVKIVLNGHTYFRDFHFDPEGSTGGGGGMSFP